MVKMAHTYKFKEIKILWIHLKLRGFLSPHARIEDTNWFNKNHIHYHKSDKQDQF